MGLMILCFYDLKIITDALGFQGLCFEGISPYQLSDSIQFLSFLF